MNKDAVIFTTLAVGMFATMVGLAELDKKREREQQDKERELKKQKLENEKLYFSKLTPEQVQDIELKKVQLEREKVELKMTEAELKKTIDKFKHDIQSEIQRTTNENIERDMRKTFDNWAAKYEDRLDKKIDRVVSRIDDLSDKYGGVKQQSAVAPSINVVNAPNN